MSVCRNRRASPVSCSQEQSREMLFVAKILVFVTLCLTLRYLVLRQHVSNPFDEWSHRGSTWPKVPTVPEAETHTLVHRPKHSSETLCKSTALDGVSRHTFVSELQCTPSRPRVFTAFLHGCKAISSVHNICQRFRQLLQPVQLGLLTNLKSGCSTALQCSLAACKYFARTGTAFVGLSMSVITASILVGLLAAVLMLLAATCMLSVCLLVFPLAVVIAPACWLARQCWARRHSLSYAGLCRNASALFQQKQQTVRPALTPYRPRNRQNRLQNIGQTRAAPVPSTTRQAMRRLLTWRVTERLEACLICLQDIGISKMAHLEDCNHGYCKACTAMHLQTKLTEDQHDMLRCPFPRCTAMFTVAQCQEVLSHDAAAMDRVAQLAAIASIPQENRFYCPHTACSSLIEVKPELAARQPKQWCWECRNWMCIQCQTAWHENVSCDQNMQDPHTRQLMGMAVVEGLAQCPRCGFVVQRTEGCDNMTCRCGGQFNYSAARVQRV